MDFHQNEVLAGLKKINKSEKSLENLILKTGSLLEECCQEAKLDESYRVYIRDYAKYSHYDAVFYEVRKFGRIFLARQASYHFKYRNL